LESLNPNVGDNYGVIESEPQNIVMTGI